MSHVIKIKRSETAGSVPQTSDLQTHELAMNVSDKTIYTKNSSGEIVTLTSAVGSIGSILKMLFVLPSSLFLMPINIKAWPVFIIPTQGKR